MKKDLAKRKQILTKWTKYLLDFMFYSGIVVTVTLPISLKWIGQYLQRVAEHYWQAVIIYFILGIAAVILIRELRKIFKTVLFEDCFVWENVDSLRRMGSISFFIAAMSVVRIAVYPTMAMAVVVLVFVIAGLFSKVLALIFEQAISFKEENDLTI